MELFSTQHQIDGEGNLQNRATVELLTLRVSTGKLVSAAAVDVDGRPRPSLPIRCRDGD